MKKLLIYAALMYGGYTLLSKKNQIEDLKGNLKIKPKNIRNLKFVPGAISLLTDINLTNNSDMDFSLNSFGTIKLTKITFFTSGGELIGTAYPNITNIQIGPHSNVLLPNVPATINTQNVGSLISQILLNPGEYETVTEIEILGNKYII